MKKECSKFNYLSISELIVSFFDNLVNAKTVPIESNYENGCIYYFKRMLNRRYIQLINSNDPVAARNLANLFKHNHSFSGLLYSKAASLGDVESIINLGWMFVNNKSNDLINKEEKKLFFSKYLLLPIY
jgi:TPR repeat protein